MAAKTLILSSSGLGNVVFTKTKEVEYMEEFRFILGNEELKTNYLFAEFISPRVSKLHQADPTINYLNFTKYYQHQSDSNSNIDKMLLEQVDELSRGKSIEVTKENIFYLQQISIILGNDELFTKLNELFPENSEEEQINKSLHSLLFFESNFFNFQTEGQQESNIDFISRHFYMIDEEKLLRIPIKILYLIVSNEHLKLKDEDSLLDFIDKLFDNNDYKEEDKMKFYENVEFKSLSEEKMKKIVFNLNPSEMTNSIWRKLIECFYSNSNIVKSVKTVEERMSNHRARYCKYGSGSYHSKTIDYDNNKNNRFKGIINELGRGNPLNVINEGIIDVSSSSLYTDSYSHLNHVFDFNNDKKIFESQNKPNSWFCYDFKGRKVKLSHYSLRSHGFDDKYNMRLRTWVIEGSNDNKDWRIIDQRSNEESVTDVSASNTFKIDENNSANDFYRFIRIRQSGTNNSNNNYLLFSVIEFFGTILEP